MQDQDMRQTPSSQLAASCPRHRDQSKKSYRSRRQSQFQSKSTAGGGFDGIGFDDVETTFSLEPDARYGARGSIRTDVVLRNAAGDIVAIYDVKTGKEPLGPKRVREIREKTGAGPNVPVFEVSILQGVTRKFVKVPAQTRLDHYCSEMAPAIARASG